MRIGVLTFHYVQNYGAVWQAYALCKKLKTMGHSVELVDYRSPAAGHMRKWWHPSWILREMAFRKFVRRQLPISALRFTTHADLQRMAGRYDAYVFGSDQVWNCLVHTEPDLVYFGEGLPSARFVAYAASMGGQPIPEACSSRVRACLGRFSAISLREEQGRTQVEDLAGRSVETVLDPTLLDIKYDDAVACGTNTGRTSVLTFCLTKSREFEQVATAVTYRSHGSVKSYGWPVRLATKAARTDGPAEWLRDIVSADLVVTDSFHGTALSIAFEKQFYVLLPGRRRERITELLLSLGLADRIVDNRTIEKTLETPIDYAKIRPLLDARRRKSDAFLAAALS